MAACMLTPTLTPTLTPMLTPTLTPMLFNADVHSQVLKAGILRVWGVEWGLGRVAG